MADQKRRKQISSMLGPLEESVGANWSERLEKGLCPTCGNAVKQEDFRDDLSRKEFAQSHMCQACQDKAFDVKEH